MQRRDDELRHLWPESLMAREGMTVTCGQEPATITIRRGGQWQALGDGMSKLCDLHNHAPASGTGVTLRALDGTILTRLWR